MAEYVGYVMQFLLLPIHLPGLQSPTESEREVFLMWGCLKLFGHLLTYLHESRLGGENHKPLEENIYIGM